MARSSRQKAKGFNKFLDFIGLVDSEREDEFDPEFDQPRASNRGRGNRNAPVEDEFAEEPRMARVSSRRERPAAAASASRQGNRYDTEEEWQSGNSRPDYSSARAQQRPSSARASRYGSEQRFGSAAQSRTSGRYADNQQGENSQQDAADPCKAADRPVCKEPGQKQRCGHTNPVCAMKRQR